MDKKRLIILGSTGSIGVQTLQVVEALGDAFDVVGLSSNNRIDELAMQVSQFKPEAICVVNPDRRQQAENLAQSHRIKCYMGESGLVDLVTNHKADIVVVATVGFVGLRPTMEAIRRGCTIALANKEVLVAAGDLVTEAVRTHNAALVPIDSEHNAIFQCLRGEETATIRRIILTASGGPFRNTTIDDLERMTAKEALRHPIWSMGPKITIDSATLMNKGLEVIECYHLFGVALDQIDVVVHPQSVVHSFVEFHDGNMIAQLGLPDMRTPIQLALTNPHRVHSSLPSLDLTKAGALTFEPPDTKRFPCLRLAFDAMRRGGTAPVALNAANEVAVREFLDGGISFMDIPRLVEKVLLSHDFNPSPDLNLIFESDAACRNLAEEYVRELSHQKVN